MFETFETYDPVKLCNKLNIICRGVTINITTGFPIRIKGVNHILYNDELSELDMNIFIARMLFHTLFHRGTYPCDYKVIETQEMECSIFAHELCLRFYSESIRLATISQNEN